VEIGEVENALESHPSVRAAAVNLVGDPSADGYLAAFAVAADQPGLAAQLWDHAARLLPGYAMPGRITVVEALPQTVNGKVDIAALAASCPPEPREPRPTPLPPDTAAPDGSTSARLAVLWAEVLRSDQPDEQANFFLEGGTSLEAVKLAERASEMLGVPVTMGMVFRAPTPAALASALSATGATR
jgi:hypothetical protein